MINKKLIQDLDTTAYDMLVALEDLDLIVCRVNNKGKIVAINSAWEKITGFTKEDLYEKPFVSFIHKDDIEDTMSVYKEAFEDECKKADLIKGYKNRYKTKEEGKYAVLKWWGTKILVNGTHLSFAALDDYIYD